MIAPGAQEFQLRNLRLEMGLVRSVKMALGGGIVIYAEGTDLVDQALACLKFYQSESCGKCVPCRIGTTKLVEIGADLHAGEMTAAEADALMSAKDGGLVFELAQVMAETAICGLGNIAALPLHSLLKYFPEDVKQRVRA